ncbi:MAG: ferritin-like domain-containing protein [Thermaceae bacterium]|nr:ferritin-like domain-containing protein [Thermaceae bacterium]
MSVLNRRQALQQFGVVGAGALVGGVMTACSTTLAAKPNVDGDVLNFALNLEYLEAAFYLAAVGRLGELSSIGGSATINLPTGFTGSSPIPNLSDAVSQYANEIATDELNHVKAIRGALGAKAVDRPVLDLNASFTTAGNLASSGAITNFNPFANELFFLHGAFVFEDVGVTAYHGAARLLTDDSVGGVLDTAAGILAVEAYHASEIRTLLYAQKDVQVTPSLKVSDVVQAISNLRGSVGGGKDQGILDANGKANIIPTDSNGVAYGRSTAEVLAIVYLGGSGKGGFFPSGLNGNIK